MSDPEPGLDSVIALHRAGQLAEARAGYERLLRTRPDDLNLLYLSGCLAIQTGSPEDAAPPIIKALALAPNFPEALCTWAIIQERRGEPQAAIESLRRALALRPDYADGEFNLGLILENNGRGDEAIPHYRRAVALKPENADAHYRLGWVLRAGEQFEAAAEAFRAVTVLRPDGFDGWERYGESLMRANRTEEALEAFREALIIRPDFMDGHYVCGLMLHEIGRLDEAIESYNVTVDLKADHVDARFNRGMAYLQKGDLVAGWRDYEQRWVKYKGQFDKPIVPEPEWRGERLAAPLLVYCEQGLGDTIQFARFLPLLRQRVPGVILLVQPPLLSVMQGVPGADLVVKQGMTLPRYAALIPLMSLARILRTQLSTIPADIPYLAPRAEDVAVWRERLGPPAGLRVAIVWAGSAIHPGDGRRSIPLTMLAPLLALPGIEFVSFQVGPRVADLADLPEPRPRDVSPWLEDFAQTAAALATCDLCITVDTSVAHLAGAMGHPTWLMLPLYCDWRWLLGRSDSPWYPSMRLFRQTARDDWTTVIPNLVEALRALASSRAGAPATAPNRAVKARRPARPSAQA